MIFIHFLLFFYFFYDLTLFPFFIFLIILDDIVAQQKIRSKVEELAEMDGREYFKSLSPKAYQDFCTHRVKRKGKTNKRSHRVRSKGRKGRMGSNRRRETNDIENALKILKDGL